MFQSISKFGSTFTRDKIVDAQFKAYLIGNWKNIFAAGKRIAFKLSLYNYPTLGY